MHLSGNSNSFTYGLLMRLGSIQCSSAARKHSKTPLDVVFDLYALAAGESLPLSQTQCGRDGICTGNSPRYLLDQLEIFDRIGTLVRGSRAN